ncbi:MAG TPA: hypothetical protein VMV44_06000 [Rectinemataceae bacterium]|nr:hypothetical protein [Rectinemataceae bacterium]
MADDLFATLSAMYKPGIFSTTTTFYFSIDDTKKTVTLGPEGCAVTEGKTVENADCVCKTGADFLAKIWDQGYRPGPMDFMSGKIKSNAPQLLQQFLRAFGKS